MQRHIQLEMGAGPPQGKEGKLAEILGQLFSWIMGQQLGLGSFHRMSMQQNEAVVSS